MDGFEGWRLHILDEAGGEGADVFAVQYVKLADFFNGLDGKPFEGNMNDPLFVVTGHASPACLGWSGRDDGDMFFAGMKKRRFQKFFLQRFTHEQAGVLPDVDDRPRWENHHAPAVGGLTDARADHVVHIIRGKKA